MKSMVKLLSVVSVALTLVVVLSAVKPAEAGAPGVRTWAQFEVRFQYVYGPTGQVWNQGFTYTRYWDCRGNYVRDDGLAQIQAFRRDMRNQRWAEVWCSGDGCIAQGTW